MQNKETILKVLVGSHAHGLATPKSDYDYRAVYVLPTSDILSMGYEYKGSSWIEGEKEDQTAWEIGHFLHLATKCNPSILEVFKAPKENLSTYFGKEHLMPYGEEIRELFPYLWEPKQAFNAFVGYGLNQRKKMLDNHLDRWPKYGCAYLRTLWNLCDLLEYKDFSLEIKDPKFKNELIEIKAGSWTNGQIVDKADQLTKRATALLSKCENKPDHNRVNEFLLKIRKEYW